MGLTIWNRYNLYCIFNFDEQHQRNQRLQLCSGFFLIALAFSILLVASTTRGVIAQNLTINASNAVGMQQRTNQMGTEVAKNVSSSAGNASKSANQTMIALGNNASGTMNKTGPSNNSSDLGGNTSLIGSAQQLGNVLGNNSEILANNTSIGNSNMSLGEKMSTESNATRNQTGDIWYYEPSRLIQPCLRLERI